MQAEIGAADTPAHRGLAYVVFEDLALEKFGNRIPNFNFEVVSAGDSVRPDVTQLSTVDAANPLYDPSTGRVARLFAGGTYVVFYDYWTGINLGSLLLPDSAEQLEHGSPGTLWAINETGSAYIISFSSMSILETVSKPSWREFGAWSNYDNKMILASSNLSTDISVFEKVDDSWGYLTYGTVSSTNNEWGGIVVIPAFGPLATNAGLQAGWSVLYNGDKICVLDTNYSARLNYQCATVSADYGGSVERMAYDHERHCVYITNYLDEKFYVVDMDALSVTVHSLNVG
jgi:hypothetical protein